MTPSSSGVPGQCSQPASSLAPLSPRNPWSWACRSTTCSTPSSARERPSGRGAWRSGAGRPGSRTRTPPRPPAGVSSVEPTASRGDRGTSPSRSGAGVVALVRCSGGHAGGFFDPGGGEVVEGVQVGRDAALVEDAGQQLRAAVPARRGVGGAGDDQEPGEVAQKGRTRPDGVRRSIEAACCGRVWRRICTWVIGVSFGRAGRPRWVLWPTRRTLGSCCRARTGEMTRVRAGTPPITAADSAPDRLRVGSGGPWQRPSAPAEPTGRLLRPGRCAGATACCLAAVSSCPASPAARRSPPCSPSSSSPSSSPSSPAS